MNLFYRLKKYTIHAWQSKKGKYAHSPFIYNLSIDVFDKKKALQETDLPKLLQKKKYIRLINRLITCFDVKTIVTIGGESIFNTWITSCYCKNSRIFLLEENSEKTHKIARHLSEYNSANMEQILGPYEETVPCVLEKIPQIDMLFIAETHTPLSVYNYFETGMKYASNNTVFIVENLYRSPEMETVWKKIKEHPKTTVTIDLFALGIVWLRRESSKESFTIKY